MIAEQEVRLADHNDEAFDIVVRWLSDRDSSPKLTSIRPYHRLPSPRNLSRFLSEAENTVPCRASVWDSLRRLSSSLEGGKNRVCAVG